MLKILLFLLFKLNIILSFELINPYETSTNYTTIKFINSKSNRVIISINKFFFNFYNFN